MLEPPNVNPKDEMRRPPTQIIMVKLIKASFFISILELPPKLVFKKSALDVKKTKFLKLRGRRFPNGGFGKQNRNGYRSKT